MPVDPQTIQRFTSDSQVHEVVKVSDNDPVLTNAGWFRTTSKCGLTCDCHPADLEDPLRFQTTADPVTCLACLAAP